MMWDTYRPGSPGGEMKCPTCGENTPDDWKEMLTRGMRTSLEGPRPHNKYVTLDWMKCANPSCEELVIRVHEAYVIDGDMLQVTASYRVRPRFLTRPVSDEVPEPFRTDYLEAAAIADISPRMSSVLSRRVLSDVLKQYANLTQFRLPDQIDAFISDTSHPRNVRENLHYLREIADFGAHTQTDTEDEDEILDFGRKEAEWVLEVLDSLFEYLIIRPLKDAAMRAALDETLDRAGRKPFTALPEDREEGQ